MRAVAVGTMGTGMMAAVDTRIVTVVSQEVNSACDTWQARTQLQHGARGAGHGSFGRARIWQASGAERELTCLAP